VGFVVAIAAAAGLGWWAARHLRPDRLPAAPAAVDSKTDLQRLVGRWRRPDGGYVIEIRGIDGGGAASAAYFNPRPIHVATATASSTDGVPALFIELRDAGYPGSTYTLSYRKDGDLLAGEYYQAAMGDRFPVVFERER
jgi:hypothetical protein